MSDLRDVELLTRAAIDAVGPLLAQVSKRAADAEANALRRIAELEAEVKALRERVALASIPPRDGRDGVNGRDGIDGTFREPTDYEAGKSYPYGAIVRHRGGLWHAQRMTDAAPEAERSGWTLIVNGVHAVRVTAGDDLRGFALELEPSAGAVERHAFTLPVVIYRGVHEQGKHYAQGDAVTRDGNFWIARKATRTDPGPEEWQLAVRRGRDGKGGDKGLDAPTFHGFYDPRTHYPPNALVRTSSGLWLSTKATQEPPPADAAHGEQPRAPWRLYLPTVTH
jgi:hypothetical protein